MNERGSLNKVSNEKVDGNKTQKELETKFVAQNPSPRKNFKWQPGAFKSLQFGKSKKIGHLENEYDNPIDAKIDYAYDDEPQIITDKKSGIVEEI